MLMNVTVTLTIVMNTPIVTILKDHLHVDVQMAGKGMEKHVAMRTNVLSHRMTVIHKLCVRTQ